MAGIFDDPGWSADQIFNATAAEVIFKNSVWIVQITDDQIETRQVVCQLCWQFRSPREEFGERPIFDRAYCLRVKAVLGKNCNVLVTKNLDMRTRPGIPQRFERRQGQDEIADCAAADHQYALEHRLVVF